MATESVKAKLRVQRAWCVCVRVHTAALDPVHGGGFLVGAVVARKRQHLNETHTHTDSRQVSFFTERYE